jgi:hypothetical protein
MEKYMFEINKDIICSIIKRAREINIASDLATPDNGDDLSDAEIRQHLAEFQDDLSFQEVRDLINDLDPDQQQKIIALMYMGRGDYDGTEWQAALEQALTVPEENRADYLLSKPGLADYLSDGLQFFNYTCEE